MFLLSSLSRLMQAELIIIIIMTTIVMMKMLVKLTSEWIQINFSKLESEERGVKTRGWGAGGLGMWRFKTLNKDAWDIWVIKRPTDSTTRTTTGHVNTTSRKANTTNGQTNGQTITANRQTCTKSGQTSTTGIKSGQTSIASNQTSSVSTASEMTNSMIVITL